MATPASNVDVEINTKTHGQELIIATERRNSTLQLARSSGDEKEIKEVVDANIRAAFDFIDVNNDLSLSRREVVDSINRNDKIRELLLMPEGKFLKATDFDAIFAKLDKNSDDDITFLEFQEAMREMLTLDWKDQIIKKERDAADLIKKLKQEGAWELEKARRRLTAAIAIFDPLIHDLQNVLGVLEAAQHVEKIKNDVVGMLTSDRPIEKKMAEAWYEVCEAQRFLTLLNPNTDISANNVVERTIDPLYEKKVSRHLANIQKFGVWRNVHLAYDKIMSSAAEQTTVASFFAALAANEEALSLIAPEETTGLAGLLFAATDAAREEESSSPTANILFSLADDYTSPPLSPPFLQEMKEIVLKNASSSSNFTINFNLFQLAVNPTIGRVQNAFVCSLNSTDDHLSIEKVKRILFDASHSLHPRGSAEFDDVYLHLVEMEKKVKEGFLTLDQFTALFVPDFDNFVVWADLQSLLPNPNSSFSKEDLLQHWRPKTQKVLSVCSKYIEELLDGTLESILAPLPEKITQQHLVMLLAPKFLSAIMPPSNFIEASNNNNININSNSNSNINVDNDFDVVDDNHNHKQSSITQQQISIEAAFKLINDNKSSNTITKSTVIKQLRDNSLIQGLLNLPTKNHAHSSKWKAIMSKLHTLPEDLKESHFILLFAEDEYHDHSHFDDEEKKDEFPNPSVTVDARVVVEKQIPVLNLELAEFYVSAKKAFDILDVDKNNSLSLKEVQKKLTEDEHLRSLLKLPLDLSITANADELAEVVRQIEFRAMNGNINWNTFRGFFITLEDDNTDRNDHIVNEHNKEFVDHEMQMYHDGSRTASQMIKKIISSAAADFNTTKDDQEPTPAFNYDDDIVGDLNWRNEAEMDAQEEGPPPIPARGAEMMLNTPYIDGPQWYVVMSPREELGVEGPMGIKNLIGYWDEEIIDSHTLVWKEGLEDWLPVEMVADLKAQLLLPELHENIRPVTAPSVLSGIPKKRKVASNPKPTKLDFISIDRPCKWCGMLATMHISEVESIRPLKQVVAPKSATENDPDKSEILASFLYVGNASSGRERNVEIMEYTHIINVSKDLPCFWDLEDDCNEWVRNEHIVIDGDNKWDTGEDEENDGESKANKKKAFVKFKKLKSMSIKYFRVSLDDDPFGRPDTAASRYTLQTWRESEFSSRPLSALTDPLFGGTNVSNSRPGTRERPNTGMSGVSRPMTGGTSRPMTAADFDVIPEFQVTEEENDFALGYAAAAITAQAVVRGHSIRSREGGLRGIVSGGGVEEEEDDCDTTVTKGVGDAQTKLLEQAAKELSELRKAPIVDIIHSFEAVYEWLHRENMGRKVRCLIHSRTGTTSSVAIAAAYIIRSQGLKYEEVRSHLQTIHGIEKVLLAGTVWEDALKQYSVKYAIGELICDDCFLENFVEGKADERLLSEKVETVVKRIMANDEDMKSLDLRDECLGNGGKKKEKASASASASASDSASAEYEEMDQGIEILCGALRESYHLMDLNLCGNHLNDSDCEMISSALLTNRGLNSLHLAYNLLGDIGAKEIASSLKIHSLAMIDLSYNNIGRGGGEHFGVMLRKNKTLVELNLGNNVLGDEGGHFLFDSLTTPLYESEEVMLAKSKIYEEGGEVGDLGEPFNCSLTSLNVSCNGLGQESAKRLIGVIQNNMILCRLNLDYNPNLGHTEAREIASAMRLYNSNLQHLSFSDMNCGNDVAGAFAKTLLVENGGLLTRLSFSQNALRSIGVNRLANSLTTNAILKFLDLSRNPMGSKGCIHVGEALKCNVVLQELNLSCCGIDSEGCEVLRDALKINATLKVLDLSDNSLLTQGVGYLSEGLGCGKEKGRGLREIDLTNVGLGVRAGEALGKALEGNLTLEKLVMGSNQIKNQGAKAMAAMLKVNVALRVVDLSFNGISSVGIKSLLVALNVDFDADGVTNLSMQSMDETIIKDKMKTLGQMGMKKKDEEVGYIAHRLTQEQEEQKLETLRNKALELDLILVGNVYSKADGEVSSAQIMLPPKMARSKIHMEYAVSSSDENHDRSLWQKPVGAVIMKSPPPLKNVKRRGSFSIVAPEEFDEEKREEGRNFVLSEVYVKCLLKSSSEGGVLAEPVESKRFRDAEKVTKGHQNEGAWNAMFSGAGG